MWPWLLQVGQDRSGFYCCEALKNLGGLRHHDADAIHPEWQRLEMGDPVRVAPEGWMGLPDGVTLTVAEVVLEKYIVLDATREDGRWNAVWSFHLQPHWEDRVRLLTRARIGLRHPGEVFVMELVRPAIAFGTRGLLLGIKHRTERLATATPAGAAAGRSSSATKNGPDPKPAVGHERWEVKRCATPFR